MINYIKKYLRYTKFHFFILKFTNPHYLSWLKKEVNFYKKVLKKKDQLIFDLGANLGDKTHIFLSFSKNIICYEPEEDLVKKLKLRFRKYKNIIIRNYVVIDQVKNINFFSVKGNESHSSILEGYINNFEDLKNTQVTQKKKDTTTLNEEINLYGIPYYCKIDCEGSEKLILKDLSHKIKIISFEANIPTFYQETIDIIKIFNKKFKCTFNLRKDNEYDFFFQENQNAIKLEETLTNKPSVYEVFIFTE